jgi:hypothetical protein
VQPVKRLLLLALVTPALLLGACGDDDDDGGSVDSDLLANAASATVDRGSSRIAMSGSISGPGLPGKVPIKADGVVDNAKRVGRLNFDFSSLAESIPEGSGLDQASFKGEMIIDKLVVYMRFPFLAQLLPSGADWIKIDAEALSEAAGVDLGSFSQLGQTDPSQSLQYLRAVSGDVEEVGTEEVRGVETTHYKATVDLEKVPDVLPEDQREAMRKSIDALVKQAGTNEIPVEVWVDEDGLVRRMRQDFSFDAEGGQGKADFTVDIEMYDFGVEVDVEPPPEEDTVDITKLGAGLTPQPQ